MPRRNTLVRSLHDVGLGVWFGGSLMGAVGLNGAAQSAADQKDTRRIASAGWAKWNPVQTAALGAHLIGGVGMLRANRRRVEHQRGMGASTVAKTALTGAALAASAYAGVLGGRIHRAAAHHAGKPEEQPQAAPNGDVDQAERQMRFVQWCVPVLTGGLEVLNALQGEQQRGDEQARGMAAQFGQRLRPVR